MKSHIRTLVALLLALCVPSLVLAHEGHAHKLMGTVTAVAPQRLELKTKDGKSMTVVLDEKTAFMKGKEAARASDLAEGQRVVVTTDEGQPPRALQVVLGATKTTAKLSRTRTRAR